MSEIMDIYARVERAYTSYASPHVQRIGKHDLVRTNLPMTDELADRLTSFYNRRGPNAAVEIARYLSVAVSLGTMSILLGQEGIRHLCRTTEPNMPHEMAMGVPEYPELPRSPRVLLSAHAYALTQMMEQEEDISPGRLVDYGAPAADRYALIAAGKQEGLVFAASDGREVEMTALALKLDLYGDLVRPALYPGV